MIELVEWCKGTILNMWGICCKRKSLKFLQINSREVKCTIENIKSKF